MVYGGWCGIKHVARVLFSRWDLPTSVCVERSWYYKVISRTYHSQKTHRCLPVKVMYWAAVFVCLKLKQYVTSLFVLSREMPCSVGTRHFEYLIFGSMASRLLKQCLTCGIRHALSDGKAGTACSFSEFDSRLLYAIIFFSVSTIMYSTGCRHQKP